MTAEIPGAFRGSSVGSPFNWWLRSFHVLTDAQPAATDEESQVSSSNGRAADSKSACWGFESLLACAL